jgi:outer membrane protein assembly factor BamB
MNKGTAARQGKFCRGLFAIALVLAGSWLAIRAAAPAHASPQRHMKTEASDATWKERPLLHEQRPSDQVVSDGSLYALVSRTNTPERGPYRLMRTALATGKASRGPLFAQPNIAIASGHIWVSGSENGLPRAVEIDPVTLRTIRTINFSQGYGAFPFVEITAGPAGSVWLGSDRTLLRVSAATGKTLTRTSIPAGFVVANITTDPGRTHLYVSLAGAVKGGMAGGALIEDDAATGRQLATASSTLLTGSVAGAGVTAVPGGVWASFRTGMLGLTLHFRQGDLAQIAPTGPKIAASPANGLFHWPMSASLVYGSGALWLTNESGVLACLDPETGMVRARERISPQEVLDLLAVDAAGRHLFALDNATTVIEITAPRSCRRGS